MKKGSKHTLKTLQKLRCIQSNRSQQPMAGKTHSFKAKTMMSQAKLKNPTKYWLGKKRSEETKKKIAPTMFKKGESRYPEFQFKKGRTSMFSGKKVPSRAGSNHYNWKGGVTSVNEKMRNSLEYKNWRKAVFDRDNYTCQKCGERGGKLNADHELPFSLYPDLRLEVLNGRTLCKKCHKKTITYGFNIKKYEYITLYNFA